MRRMANWDGLIQKVRIFGLHLVPLDVREDAQRLATAIKELFASYGLAADYSTLPEAERQKLLTEEIANPRPFFPVEPHFGPNHQRSDCYVADDRRGA